MDGTVARAAPHVRRATGRPMSTGAPRNPTPADTSRDAADDMPRAARVRRTAWVLGVLALAFYVGFMVLTAIEGPR